MTNQDYINLVIALVSRVTGVPSADITDHSKRSHPILAARRDIIRVLQNSTNMNITEIVKAIGLKSARVGDGVFKHPWKNESWLKTEACRECPMLGIGGNSKGAV